MAPTAVVHVAGAVRAADVATFFTVNAHGSASARRRGIAPARLSAVASVLAGGAGMPRSRPTPPARPKARQRPLGLADRLQVVVVRPPAVYGPADRATLPLLRGLNRGRLVHPHNPGGRFSLTLRRGSGAASWCALLADPPPGGTILEPDDGRAGGYSWADLAMVPQQRLAHRVRRISRADGCLLSWRHG